MILRFFFWLFLGCWGVFSGLWCCELQPKYRERGRIVLGPQEGKTVKVIMYKWIVFSLLLIKRILAS